MKKHLLLFSLLAVLSLSACYMTSSDKGGKQDGSTSSAHTHSWGSWSEATPATCLEGGTEERTCIVCGEKDTPRQTNALGHNWDAGVIQTAATETSDGVKLFTCLRCGQTKTESYHLNIVPTETDPTLSDAETSNMEIAFNNVSDNCMVSPKVKAYVDAMETQELTLDKPYHFSPLYGPDNYQTIANASDKGDGTTYAAVDTGGVDVCQMLNRNDYSNSAKNYPIQLSWNNGSNTFSSAKLKFWSTEDKSDMREVSLGANATSASLENLFRARKYRAQIVKNDGNVSQGF